MSVSTPRRPLARASALVGCCLLAAACSASSASHPAATSTRAKARASPSAVIPAAVTRNTPSSTAPPPRPRVRITRVRTGDGALVTVATFLGPVRYVLHDGSGDPGPVPGLRAGPAVTGAERLRLLAAFNGGFKLSVGVGGYMQEGHVISPGRGWPAW